MSTGSRQLAYGHRMHLTGRVLMLTLTLLTAGCGPARGSGAPPSPAVGDASRVDMCTVLTDTELIGLGIKLNSRKSTNRLGSLGCGWNGLPFTLDLERDNETVAQYRARRHTPAFTSFEDNAVNGRDAAHLSINPDREDCTQLMDGGPVSLTVSVAPSGLWTGPKVDSCAEAMRIAQVIETRLPKVGS